MRSHALAKRIGIISPICQKDVAALNGAKHVLRASTVVGLAFSEFEQDGQACSIDQSVDLGGQAARRATNATGSDFFFCRSQHADEGRSSGYRRHKLLIQRLKADPTHLPCAIG